MEKQKLISKLNIKNYNNELEEILAKKDFSEDAKNLLLNMLYKIENSYKDYSTVTGNIKSKNEILEEILKIIDNDCMEIETVKTTDKKNASTKKKITTYMNDRKMLYELYQINHCKFKISKKYEIVKYVLEGILNQGYSIFSSEIIRDFNGWAWTINVDEIENHKANLIYQTLRIIVGQDFLEEWRQNKDKEQDYYEKLREILEKKYDKNIASKVLKIINQIALLNVIERKKSAREKIIEMLQELQNKYSELNNRQAYIDNLVINKKQSMDRIKEIDNLLLDNQKLKVAFMKKNKSLDIEHKIFSLSDFADILEQEKKDLIKKVKVCNKNMAPLNYAKQKIELEEKIELLKEIDVQKITKRTYNKKIQELIQLVFEIFKLQIRSFNEKESILKLIYLIRYYELIYVDEKTQVIDLIDIKEVHKLAITTACKRENMTIFSKIIKENYEILNNIFQSDIIELEKIYLKIFDNKGKIKLEIYDENTMYKTIEMNTIKGLNVKPNKRIKVFI